MVKETKLYDLLGVSPTANEQELKKGYRKAALKYHPDKPTGDTEKFKEISEAFEILNDPNTREVYDQYGLEAARSGGPSFGGAGAGGFPGGAGGFSGHQFSNDDAFNMFSQFFGGSAGGDPFSGGGFHGMGGMPGGMPVSYTHLDVYKRQIILDLFWINERMELKEGLPMTIYGATSFKRGNTEGVNLIKTPVFSSSNLNTDKILKTL